MLFHGMRAPLLAAACVSSSLPLHAQFADYELTDNVEGAHVQLNSAPVRPMVLDSENSLWAVNTHDSTIERFQLDGAAIIPDPVEILRVPWGPVSIATYPGISGVEELLVVGRNTWCLLRIERATGIYLEQIPLDAEPSDIVVSGDLAFISCMGADAVRQIDLTNYDGVHTPGGLGTDDARYDASTPAFRMKSPYFLALDGSGRVLVAPLHSGNNTTADGTSTGTNNSQEVVALDELSGLPDEDLFRIDPASGTVQVAAVGMGTVLFAHGFNPVDGAYWQLNTEAHNTLAQTEEQLKGVFASNRLTRIANPSLGVRPDPSEHVLLDPAGFPSPFTVANTLAQPFALTFHSDGRGFVAGMGSDNVALFDSNATLLREWDLPAGSIPRGLLLATVDDGSSSNEYIFVYCWGTNTIEVYDFAAPDPLTPSVTLGLSHDPTPQAVSDGRKVFFDSSNSASENLSCATCHVDAGTDFLVWNLSSGPEPGVNPHSVDHKGPMVTQTLVGLERLAPFHWRGERDELEDFNGAFVGLLGNDDPLSDEDFADMKAFLFALANPANPFQHRDRILDGTNEFPGANLAVADPAVWQDEYQNDRQFQGRFACVECHALPTGTNNDLFVDGASTRVPERAFFKPTPFHEAWRKLQPTVSVTLPGAVADDRALLGAGTSHAGTTTNILTFTETAIPVGPYLHDTVSFVHQWDQGLAPAVHASFLLTPSTPAVRVTSELEEYLVLQAEERNCDLVVFGLTTVGGSLRTVRWFYDRSLTDVPFIPDDSSLSNRSLADFTDLAFSGSKESNLFVGLPVGMGERFSIDFDFDGLRNVDDPEPLVVWSGGTPPHPGPPAVMSKLESVWNTTRAARLLIETFEPTLARLRYRESPSGPTVMQESLGLSKIHAFAVSDLRPSTAVDSETPGAFSSESVLYDFVVDLVDVEGNVVLGPSNPDQMTSLTTDPFIVPFDLDAAGDDEDFIALESHVLAAPPLVTLSPGGGGTLNVQVDLAAAFTSGGSPPATGRTFVLRVWKRDSGGGSLELLDAASLGTLTDVVAANTVSVRDDFGSVVSGATRELGAQGPFLVATILTDAVGETDLGFTLAAGWVATGDEVVVTVEGVVETTGISACSFLCDLEIPARSQLAWTQWNFAVTGEDRISGSAVVP